ncbi:hypothetical protein GJ496_011908 [Pomphorhynchus laevis]|nr:hypothetical protein GJ496_011908 [Pomphorhynchus laevis]
MTTNERSELANLNIDLKTETENSAFDIPSRSCRSKRPRTSFKYNQLQMMKSYFAINQNPDGKDLKCLSQETNLSKRILQVWFQNARAKARKDKVQLKRESISCVNDAKDKLEGEYCHNTVKQRKVKHLSNV